MGLKLPAGYKFCPTDKQLLEDYLKPKIQGTLSWDVIKEKEIYGPNANPWEIFDDSSTPWVTSGNQKSVYVFTRLTRMAEKDSSASGEGNEGHYVRRAGCGTWHVETGRKIIMDGDHPIGEKRMLVFQINDSHGLRNGVSYYWNMHEYLWKGNDDYVVCRITLDMLKTAKVSTKEVSARRGRTKSKASKKSATTRTTETEREKAVLVDSFCGSGKEAASNMDDSGCSNENQRCQGQSNEVVYPNLLAPMNTICHDGSDQSSILNQGNALYDYAGGITTVEEPQGQGLQVLNNDQRLHNEELAQPMIPTGEGSQNLGTELSDFHGGSHDDLYLDLEDMFGAGFWSDMDNVLNMEHPLPDRDVPLDLESLLDAGAWSDKTLEEPGQVNNNVQEQERQWQPPTQNMSCMLGKRGSLEAQEAGPAKRSRM